MSQEQGAAPESPIEPTQLFLTQRSATEKSLARCMRLRFLEFCFGGYGIRLKPRAIPLATGSALHRGGELSLLYMQEHNEVPSRDAMRGFIADAIGEYLEWCETRGFQQTESDDNERVMHEQICLIEGLAWTVWKILLPALHQHFVVVAVEQEDVLVWDCDCGLGDEQGDYTEHETRGCGGIGVQVRGDAYLRSRSSGELVCFDWKSDGNVHRYDWAEQFRASMQMALQVISGERLLGEPISGGVIVAGLHKGWRSKEKTLQEDGSYAEDPNDKTKYQQSPFCYAFRKPGNPPLEAEDWRFSYYYQEWDDKKGKMVGRSLKGKGFFKASLWGAELPDKPESYTTQEWLVENFMEDEALAKQVKLTPPLFPPQHMKDALKRAMIHHEKGIREALWLVWEELEKVDGDWSRPEFQAALDRHFPQSWDCRRYNTICQFARICDREAGWQDPLGSGFYENRRPNHEPELQQAIARGAELPPEQDEEEHAADA